MAGGAYRDRAFAGDRWRQCESCRSRRRDAAGPCPPSRLRRHRAYLGNRRRALICQGKARLSLPRLAAYIFAATRDSRMSLVRFLILMLPALVLAACDRGRTGAARADLAGRGEAVLCAGGGEGGTGGGQRLRRQGGRKPQPVFGRSFLPPLLRRRRRAAARAPAKLARLRRHRRCRRPGGDQQSRDRGRRRGEGGARRQARIRGGDRVEGPAYRSRRAAHQGFARALSGDRARRLRRPAWSATWCWRSAILSPSARP